MALAAHSATMEPEAPVGQKSFSGATLSLSEILVPDAMKISLAETLLDAKGEQRTAPTTISLASCLSGRRAAPQLPVAPEMPAHSVQRHSSVPISLVECLPGDAISQRPTETQRELDACSTPAHINIGDLSPFMNATPLHSPGEPGDATMRRWSKGSCSLSFFPDEGVSDGLSISLAEAIVTSPSPIWSLGAARVLHEATPLPSPGVHGDATARRWGAQTAHLSFFPEQMPVLEGSACQAVDPVLMQVGPCLAISPRKVDDLCDSVPSTAAQSLPSDSGTPRQDVLLGVTCNLAVLDDESESSAEDGGGPVARAGSQMHPTLSSDGSIMHVL